MTTVWKASGHSDGAAQPRRPGLAGGQRRQRPAPRAETASWYSSAFSGSALPRRLPRSTSVVSPHSTAPAMPSASPSHCSGPAVGAHETLVEGPDHAAEGQHQAQRLPAVEPLAVREQRHAQRDHEGGEIDEDRHARRGRVLQADEDAAELDGEQRAGQQAAASRAVGPPQRDAAPARPAPPAAWPRPANASPPASAAGSRSASAWPPPGPGPRRRSSPAATPPRGRRHGPCGRRAGPRAGWRSCSGFSARHGQRQRRAQQPGQRAACRAPAGRARCPSRPRAAVPGPRAARAAA